MNETTIRIIGLLLHTAIICGYGWVIYHLGVKRGVESAVIKVLKDENIISEDNIKKG